MRTTRFWNNLLPVRSKPNNLKFVWSKNTKVRGYAYLQYSAKVTYAWGRSTLVVITIGLMEVVLTFNLYNSCSSETTSLINPLKIFPMWFWFNIWYGNHYWFLIGWIIKHLDRTGTLQEYCPLQNVSFVWLEIQDGCVR